MNATEEVQIRDLLGVIRRRGKLIVGTAGAVILTMYWIAMALPNQYTASSTILVEPQSIDEKLVTAGVRSSDLNERLGIMTAQILSRSRLSKLIDELGLYPEESKRMVRQEVVDLMRAHVSVEPVLSELELDQRNRKEVEFNTFRIIFRSASAELAAAVTNSIANDFINANIQERVQVSQRSLDFMDDSIKSLRDGIVVIEANIKRVKAESAGSLPEDLEVNHRILQSTMAELRDAQRALDVAQSDQAFWKNQVIAAVSLTTPNDVTSPAFRKKALAMERGQLISMGYTAKHPDLIRIDNELALVEREIVEQQEKGGSDEEGPDSYAEQNARSEERRAQLRAEAAQSEVERLKKQLELVQQRIAETPIAAAKLDELNREYSHLNASFLDFSARRQQAVVQASLERKQLGEQFRILEMGFAPVRPSSPNRTLLLVLGVMLGLGVGVAAGLMRESVDSSVHGISDLQEAAAIPVLASIPNIVTEFDRALRTRVLVRQGVAAMMVVVFCLLGGGLTYVWVNGAPGFLHSQDEAKRGAEGTPVKGTGDKADLPSGSL